MSDALGFVYPIGTRVVLPSGSPEMLVVDLDSQRSRVLAAWKDGDAVSERWFQSTELNPSRSTATRS